MGSRAMAISASRRIARQSSLLDANPPGVMTANRPVLFCRVEHNGFPSDSARAKAPIIPVYLGVAYG